MSLESMFDNIAGAALGIFGSSATIYYIPRLLPEKRKDEQRYEIKAAESASSFVSVEGGATVWKNGKVFSVVREEIESINATRHPDLKPAPAGRDFILVVRGDREERWEIDSHNPFGVIGPTNSLYQINTVLYEKNDAG